MPEGAADAEGADSDALTVSPQWEVDPGIWLPKGFVPLESQADSWANGPGDDGSGRKASWPVRGGAG